jgi:hypothetical protein
MPSFLFQSLIKDDGADKKSALEKRKKSNRDQRRLGGRAKSLYRWALRSPADIGQAKNNACSPKLVRSFEPSIWTQKGLGAAPRCAHVRLFHMNRGINSPS